jgi:hypothetical protein
MVFMGGVPSREACPTVADKPVIKPLSQRALALASAQGIVPLLLAAIPGRARSIAAKQLRCGNGIA